MKTFVKINLNDIVYDKEQKVGGKVKFINNQNHTAKIEVIVSFDKENSERVTKLIESKLHNLVVVTKAKPKKTYDPNKWWSWVRRFHVAFNHPVGDKPQVLDRERAVPRTIWTGEELVEFLHASSKNEQEFLESYDQFIAGLEKAKEKSLKSEYNENEIDTIVAQADALADALYFILGSFVEAGIKPDKIIEAIQASNMSKLGEDGKPIYRESDGKIVKSDKFFPPEGRIKEEIERQLGR